MANRWEHVWRAYAGVEADGLRVHADAAELDQLLKLDGQRRHDGGLCRGTKFYKVAEAEVVATSCGLIIVSQIPKWS